MDDPGTPTFGAAVWRRFLPAASTLLILTMACSVFRSFVGQQEPTPTPETLAPDNREPEEYPVRYYPEGADLSLEPPPWWKVTQPSGPPDVAEFRHPTKPALIRLGALSNDSAKSAQEAAEALLAAWLPSKSIAERTDEPYGFADGSAGWRIDGLLNPSDSESHAAERIHLVAMQAGDRAYGLLAAVRLDQDPTSTEDAFGLMARSMRPEPTEPIEVPLEHALLLAGDEPLSLDPALTRFGADGLIGDLFSGLVALDPDLQVRPDLAESWDVSSDGTVYTFHLDPAARFHNGRPVQAQDIVFSWQRAADPDTASPTVLDYMGDIVGLRSYYEGTSASISGIQILDPMTLQVRIDGSKPYFLAKLSYPVSWIVDRYGVGLPHWDEHPNGTGPFRHVQHLQDQIFILERNPYYYAQPPLLDFVVYKMYAGYTQQLYELGEVHTTRVSRDQVARTSDPADGLFGQSVTEPPMCTSYIAFDTDQPPFQDPRVRLAFAHAIDRELYVEATSNGEDLVARGLLPPAMPGASYSIHPPAYDPELARKYLSESFYGSAANLPPIVWTLPSSAGAYGGSAAMLVDMWEEVLGVRVTVEGVDWESYYSRIDSGQYGQILEEGWCADYPDPENFLDLLFHSRSSQNRAHYTNPAFDDLVERARTEPNPAVRLSLYQEAEQILLDNAPLVALSHNGPSYSVWKPFVYGYVPSPIGVAQHQRMWIQP